jgi:hypothetical protein
MEIITIYSIKIYRKCFDQGSFYLYVISWAIVRKLLNRARAEKKTVIQNGSVKAPKHNQNFPTFPTFNWSVNQIHILINHETFLASKTSGFSTKKILFTRKNLRIINSVFLYFLISRVQRIIELTKYRDGNYEVLWVVWILIDEFLIMRFWRGFENTQLQISSWPDCITSRVQIILKKNFIAFSKIK